MKGATIGCAGCGASIPDRPDRKTRFCHACTVGNRCPACGQVLPAGGGDHDCASVDLRGVRRCCDCSKRLANQGYERWTKRCGRCEKRRWRNREREQRSRLRALLGGRCQRCGYDRCQAALHFHHKDPEDRVRWNERHGRRGRNRFKTDLREVVRHPGRFELLCANCHFEEHHGATLPLAGGQVTEEAVRRVLAAVVTP